jgi:serine/threonine protein kinase
MEDDFDTDPQDVGLPLEAMPLPLPPPPPLPDLENSRFTERYRPLRKLGQGGMGEVWVAHDYRVKRDVALKTGTPNQDRDAQLRFVSEARTQAQLEHPAIVPVYDMGITEAGLPYFTMKRVNGHTLREIVDGLARGEVEITRAFGGELGRHKLLSAFANVCLTVDYAHQHEILHRDLKPDNIMLGAFGEVYVLDWGIARNFDRSTPLPHSRAVLGTPAYMPPEQRWGEADERSDVFSLGSILYEVLALRPMLDATLESDALLPPELLVACRHATAEQPNARFATARELADVVERHLAGDRDFELRRRLSMEHAARAEDAAAKALRHNDASQSRRAALAEAGRALALDPMHRAGIATLAQLLTHPPDTLPPEAAVELQHHRHRARRVAAVRGGLALLLVLALAPLGLWMGVRMPFTYVTGGAVGLLGGGLFLSLGRRIPSTDWTVGIGLALAYLCVAFISLVLSPFVLVPGLVAFIVGAVVLQRPRMALVVAALGLATVFVPLVLEWAGVIAPSYLFVGDGLVLKPRMVDLPPIATTTMLVSANVALIAATLVFFRRVGLERAALERQLYLQSWQLRQMLSPDLSKRANSP